MSKNNTDKLLGNGIKIFVASFLILVLFFVGVIYNKEHKKNFEYASLVESNINGLIEFNEKYSKHFNAINEGNLINKLMINKNITPRSIDYTYSFNVFNKNDIYKDSFLSFKQTISFHKKDLKYLQLDSQKFEEIENNKFYSMTVSKGVCSALNVLYDRTVCNKEHLFKVKI